MTNIEFTVLGGLIGYYDPKNQKIIKSLSILNPEHFSSSDGKHTIAAIKSVIAKNLIPDLITVEQELVGVTNETYGTWFSFLGEMVKNTTSISNIVEFSFRIKSEHDAKNALNILSEAADAINCQNTPNAKARIKKAAEITAQLQYEDDQTKTYCDAKSGLGELLDYMEAANDGGMTGLSTGFVHLDEVIGGLQGGEVYVLAGSPGSGKTTLALNTFLHNVMDNKKCLMYSMEMPRVQILAKLMSCKSGVYGSAIRQGDTVDNQGQAHFDAAFAALNDKSFIIEDSADITDENIDIITKAHEMRMGGVDLIVVDYLLLMGANGENETTMAANAAKAIKRLSKRYNVPVIMLTQFVKNVVGRPKKSDLKQTGQIEQDATAIFLLYKDPEQVSINPCIELEIAKNRWGETGVKYFDANFANNRFIERAEPPRQPIQPQEQKKPVKDFFQ